MMLEEDMSGHLDVLVHSGSGLQATTDDQDVVVGQAMSIEEEAWIKNLYDVLAAKYQAEELHVVLSEIFFTQKGDDTFAPWQFVAGLCYGHHYK